jgi:hypothetical protein
MRLHPAVAALLAVFNLLRPAFTRPTFDKVVPLSLGWLLAAGRRTVTTALVAGGLAGKRHHAAWHRVFSHARWDVDEVGRLVFECLLRLVGPDQPVAVAVDDTLAHKKGPHIFGLGTHVDAVRSTRRHRIFAFGHVWVVMAVLVKLPFSRRPWALPVLFRLYRGKKDCARRAEPYFKKTELARQMIEVVAGWASGRPVHVVGDCAYCVGTIGWHLPCNVQLIGTMRPDAALTAAPPPPKNPGRGRPRTRGARLPTPQALAADDAVPWKTIEVELYGRTQAVRYKSLRAQWYRACHGRLLHIVVVEVTTGSLDLRVFFSTNPDLPVEAVLQGYSQRWAIEVTFRDIKQHLGFGDSPARTRRAVECTAPFVGLLYSLVVYWYAEAGHGSPFAVIPLRPWYRHRSGVSFADMQLAVQRAAQATGFVDPFGSVVLDNNPPAAPGPESYTSPATLKARGSPRHPDHRAAA